MIIPGFLIAWLTFPGVIVHEFAHMFFCRMFGLAVLEVRFFRFAVAGPAGYVVHERSEKFTPAFFVSVGPFIVNTVLCFLICFPVYLPYRYFEIEGPLTFFTLWLGLSIGMHAFPSNQDARTLWQQATVAAKNGNLLAMLSLPLVIIIYVGNLLSIVWADLFYGLAVGLGLPELLLKSIS